MSERPKTRLEYKKYHNTGKKVPKVEVDDCSSSSSSEAVLPEVDPVDHLEVEEDPVGRSGSSQSESEVEVETDPTPQVVAIMGDVARLLIEEETISGDIDDFLDENIIKEIGNKAEDHDMVNRKVEDLRSLYRGKHIQLKSAMDDAEYQDKYNAGYQEKIKTLKEYIKTLKTQRKAIRDGEDNREQVVVDAQSAKVKFIQKQFEIVASTLEGVFISEEEAWKRETDDSVTKRKSDIAEQVKLLQSLEDKIKEMLESGADQGSMKPIEKRYEKLMEEKNKYVIRVDKEVKDREIEERKVFNKSKLNIKLSKFKGYKGIDIYSFKSDFDKLYLKTTPTDMLPDLLKNNHLENPALLLVKDVTDIEDIWTRLKSAYGDTKILLSKKVAEINDIEDIWKHKDPEKAVDGINKVVNLMKDLMRLAEEHKIEEKLYHGDAMDKIHSLMGQEKFRKWLDLSCESSPSTEKDQWYELIKFLEKEIKICQQEIIWFAKTKKKQQTPKDPSTPSSRDRSHHTHGNGGNSTSCYICGASDHVSTQGPNGARLIQYFVCPKFVEMTNKERFTMLKAKNLCLQCLYPGASSDRGKHKEGKCQRDFTCKHASHNRHPAKKHVLICDEHKEDNQNKATFEEYKRRCILRPNQVDLPSHAKNILIHHVYPSSSEDSSGDEGGVMSMQTHLKHRRHLNQQLH